MSEDRVPEPRLHEERGLRAAELTLGDAYARTGDRRALHVDLAADIGALTGLLCIRRRRHRGACDEQSE